MRIVAGRLIGAEFLASPHQDERPDGEISLIVIHGISLPAGEFGGSKVSELFLGTLDTTESGLESLAGIEVSSHLFIRRDGTIQQYVPFNRRAWHAGVSAFCDRKNCNDFSVGIELEGTDSSGYESMQYDSLIQVCSLLMNQYGATDIAGHCHIAPGRKTDPGPAFDWLRLQRGLAQRL